MSWFHAVRTRLRLLVSRDAAESRMRHEFDFHIEMEAARLVREHDLDPVEARRRALVAFGGIERHRESLRDGRGLAWLGGLRLDLTLGLRMMAKHPGLTLVGVVGMSVAVAIGAVAFGILYTIVDPELPIEDGERIVAIHNDHTRRLDAGWRTHLHDLEVWREELAAVELLGAYRTLDRNLIPRDGRPEPLRVVEMTASGFRIARVPPLLGRWLTEEDERAGAPNVLVIGHDLWQRRFAGDSSVIGRPVRLGATSHTIVGVMPEGFAFPINNRVWLPLRLQASDYAPGQAPVIEVFGRLAPGATIEDARTQLSTIARRLAVEHPATYEHIVPRVVWYPLAFLDNAELAWGIHLVQLLISMLLAVIGVNVAILVYARTAARAGEIAVRTALGASRARIVAQLFAEALVLSSTAAVVGLVVARFALRQVNALADRVAGEQLPFWIHFEISPGMVLYVLALAVFAAAIVGVLPALKATQRRVSAGLQQLGAGGSGMRLGRTWTALIVAQVAIAVAVLPVALHWIGQWVRYDMVKPSAAAKEFLTASLRLDRQGMGTNDFVELAPVATREGAAAGATAAASDASARFEERYAHRLAEVIRRLEANPAVSDVVLMSAVPSAEPSAPIEVEGIAGSSDSSAASRLVTDAGLGLVDVDYFEAFEIPILAGRAFDERDAGSALPVIVNRAFVQKVLGGGNPLGRRVRRVVRDAEGRTDGVRQGPWSEIIGVAQDFPRSANADLIRPRMYQPLPAHGVHPVTLAVRVRGGAPSTFVGPFHELTVSVDPMLRLASMTTLDAELQESVAMARVLFLAVEGLTLSVLLLSAAGIYALMSFTVTKRRREIGIRAALGAGPRRVLAGVLTKAAAQIALGIAAGLAMAALLNAAGGGDLLGSHEALVLPGVAALMAVVGLLAALGPARRALRIQPTEALRPE